MPVLPHSWSYPLTSIEFDHILLLGLESLHTDYLGLRVLGFVLS